MFHFILKLKKQNNNLGVQVDTILFDRLYFCRVVYDNIFALDRSYG